MLNSIVTQKSNYRVQKFDILPFVLQFQIVRMFIVIITTFAICWFPYHGYFIYQYYDSSIVYQVWAQHLYLSFYWLAMSTSMINPLIYYLMNSRFRNHIRQVAISFCFCRARRSSSSRHQELAMAVPFSQSRSGNPKVMFQCVRL